MMSTMDVSSILCEKILSAKIFFPKLLVVMARDFIGQDSSLEQVLPVRKCSQQCVMIMQGSNEEELRRNGKDFRTQRELSTNYTCSYSIPPSSVSQASLLSDDVGPFVEPSLNASLWNSPSCSSGYPSQLRNPEDSSQACSIIDAQSFSVPASGEHNCSVDAGVDVCSMEESMHSTGTVLKPESPRSDKSETGHSTISLHCSNPSSLAESSESNRGSKTLNKRKEVKETEGQTNKKFDEDQVGDIEKLSQEMSKWQSLPQLDNYNGPRAFVPQDETACINVKTRNRSQSVGAPTSVRVRRLSEKGKIEQKFPIFDLCMKDIWDFNNFSPVKHITRAAGIRNSAHHCFMIAVMQTLVHTAPFVRFIVEKHNHNSGAPKEKCFCCDLKEHVYRVLHVKDIPQRMDWILVYWEKMFGCEYFTTQEDAHEFLLKVLELIDRCSCPPSSPFGAIPKEPSPPMIQLFGFKLRYQLVCLACGTCSVSYALHNDLALHLPRNDGMAVPPNMHQLIKMYMKDEVLEYACPDKKCNGKAAKRTPFIFRAPSILILQVKRFLHNGKKNSMKVQVEEYLSLDQFTYSQNDNYNYELTAIISHEGSRLYSGHYTALVRGYDRQFYHFNDECVVPQKLLSARLCPYLVVYSRKDPQDRIFASPVKSRTSSSMAEQMLQQLPNSVTKQFREIAEANTTPPHLKLSQSKVVLSRKLEFYFEKDSKGSMPEVQPRTDIEQSNVEKTAQINGRNANSSMDIDNTSGSEDQKDWMDSKENKIFAPLHNIGMSKTTKAEYAKAIIKSSLPACKRLEADRLLRSIEGFAAEESKRRGSSMLKTELHECRYGYRYYDSAASRKKPRLD